MLRSSNFVLAAAVFRVAAGQTASYIQVPFSDRIVGPDGPWWGVEMVMPHTQPPIPGAESISVAIPYGGAFSQFTNATYDVGTYPAFSSAKQYYGAFLDAAEDFDEVGSSWDYDKEPGGRYTSVEWYTSQSLEPVWGNWTSTGAANWTGSEFGTARIFNIGTQLGSSTSASVQKVSSADFNTSALVFQGDQAFSLPNGTLYSLTAPLLGLGGTSQGKASPDGPGGVTAEVKKSGGIAAEAFAMHIGSVDPYIPPSLHLGGYDSKRAFGKIGVFGYHSLRNRPSELFYPQAALLDVRLGTQTGGSPFNFTDYTRSVWGSANITDDNQQIAREFGGPPNSVLTVPNPATSLIRLPWGVCDAIASYLPVIWNADYGFYFWKTNDPKYTTIVNSPAFLEFVLQDITQTNISIKVPFQLLNLTLQAPMFNDTNKPSQYLPCQSLPQNSLYDADQYYVLGRPFLQAAYFGVNYEQNLSFIAQAPGPGLDLATSVVAFKPDDRNITSSDIGKWEQTWSKSWKAMPGNTVGNPGSASGSSSGSGSSNGSGDDQPSSSNGSKVGLGAGLGVGIPALAALCGLGFLFWRRRRQAGHNDNAKAPGRVSIADPMAPPAYEDHHNAGAAGAAKGAYIPGGNQEVQEIDGKVYAPVAAPAEVDGTSASAGVGPAEIGSSSNDTAPDARVMSEMPGDFVWHEPQSARIEHASGAGEEPASPMSEVSDNNRVSAIGSGLLSPNTVTAPTSPRPVSMMSPQASPKMPEESAEDRLEERLKLDSRAGGEVRHAGDGASIASRDEV